MGDKSVETLCHIGVLKDVRAQKFPRTVFVFKLATQKGNDILLPKRPKIP